jgi:hypothetical protein
MMDGLEITVIRTFSVPFANVNTKISVRLTFRHRGMKARGEWRHSSAYF